MPISFGTILFPADRHVQFGFMFGWAKPVPVNVGRLRNPSARPHAGGGGRSGQQPADGRSDCLVCLMVMKAFSRMAAYWFAHGRGGQISRRRNSILAPLAAVRLLRHDHQRHPGDLQPDSGRAAGRSRRAFRPAASQSSRQRFDQMQSYGFMFLIAACLHRDSRQCSYDPSIYFVRSFLFAF